jgi:hypothetical protein
MNKRNSSFLRRQIDLFKSEEIAQKKERAASTVATPVYYLSNKREEEEKKREKEALEIAKSLSRHLSIWD